MGTYPGPEGADDRVRAGAGSGSTASAPSTPSARASGPRNRWSPTYGRSRRIDAAPSDWTHGEGLDVYVQSLQRLLIQYGEKVPDTGKYGPKTTEAVRHFQRQHNLPDSGVTDSRTKEELYDQLGSTAPPDWRAEVDCSGSDCGVNLDQATVASVVEDFDTGAIVRGLIKEVVLYFVCASLFRATGLRVVCAQIGGLVIDFFIGQFRKAQADQKCVQISFETTPEGSRPSGLNQTERCPT